MLPDLHTSRPGVKRGGILGTYDVVIVVNCQLLDLHIWERHTDHAAAGSHMVVAVAVEAQPHRVVAVAVEVFHHMPTAAVGVGERRTSVAAEIAVGYSIDLDLDSGRFVNLKDMIAAAD